MCWALWSSSVSRPIEALVRCTGLAGVKGRPVIWREGGRKQAVVSCFCWLHGDRLQVVHGRGNTTVWLVGTGPHINLFKARNQTLSGDRARWRAVMCLARLRWAVWGTNTNIAQGQRDMHWAAGTTRARPCWATQDLNVRMTLAFASTGYTRFCQPPVLWTKASRR